MLLIFHILLVFILLLVSHFIASESKTTFPDPLSKMPLTVHLVPGVGVAPAAAPAPAPAAAAAASLLQFDMDDHGPFEVFEQRATYNIRKPLILVEKLGNVYQQSVTFGLEISIPGNNDRYGVLAHPVAAELIAVELPLIPIS